MKNITKNEVLINQALNASERNTNASSFVMNFGKYLKVLIVSFALLSLFSCERNIASGCGTWPTANKNYKSGKHVSSVKYNDHRNNRQYAYYR